MTFRCIGLFLQESTFQLPKLLFPPQYGETDTGLKRGNPLRLCPEMMEKLRRMWLNHGVSDEIAHKMESVHLYMQTPWSAL